MTGTLAGQVVMEGFLSLRIRPWLRRLITRGAAIVPALLVLVLTNAYTSEKEADKKLLDLLVLSQVLLSLQLPFAIIPLVQMTSDERLMGKFANPLWVKVLAWISATLVVGLNVLLILFEMNKWAEEAGEAGWSEWIVYGTVGPLALGVLGFLGYVTLLPYLQRREPRPKTLTIPQLGEVRYQHIGVAVEFEPSDGPVLEKAADLAKKHGATLLLIHVVEGPVARVFGDQTADRESEQDRKHMSELVGHLRDEGLQVEGVLGFDSPPTELVRLAKEHQLDLLVMGSHGHRFLADMVLGETVSPVLHQLTIPVLVVPGRG